MWPVIPLYCQRTPSAPQSTMMSKSSEYAPVPIPEQGAIPMTAPHRQYWVKTAPWHCPQTQRPMQRNAQTVQKLPPLRYQSIPIQYPHLSTPRLYRLNCDQRMPMGSKSQRPKPHPVPHIQSLPQAPITSVYQIAMTVSKRSEQSRRQPLQMPQPNQPKSTSMPRVKIPYHSTALAHSMHDRT